MPFNKDALEKAKEYEESLQNFHPSDASASDVASSGSPYRGNQGFKLIMTTTDSVPGRKIIDNKGIVFASSSEMSGLGSGTQQDRLEKTTYQALKRLEAQAESLGANAVIGIALGANNSQGTGFTGGSSDATTAVGTAVIVE